MIAIMGQRLQRPAVSAKLLSVKQKTGEFAMIARLLLINALLLAVMAPPVLAGPAPRRFAVVNEAVGVPVFAGDIADRPYDVIGEVKAGVRKATIFSKKASEEKIFRELWERADKLGADAVINAKYGESHVTAISWGKTNATGTAIRFKPAAPATR
jgi:uncharacterized protein YbjQ (UPF0145 family)